MGKLLKSEFLGKQAGSNTKEQFSNSPEFDLERLLVAWQDAVFELYLAEQKIEAEVDSVLRLVLEQIAWHAEESGSGDIGRGVSRVIPRSVRNDV